jgi:hypothetical protein
MEGSSVFNKKDMKKGLSSEIMAHVGPHPLRNTPCSGESQEKCKFVSTLNVELLHH